MYDFGLSVLEQYDLEAKASYRGRGALVCETQKGLKIIKEFKGSEKKLRLQRELQVHIRENSDIPVDCVLENLEGELIAKDDDGIAYIVRDWFTGRECDVKSREDMFESIQMLARLHTVMYLTVEENFRKESLIDECRRHNREIRKIRTYVKKKKMKTEFERCLMGCIERFLDQGERALDELENSGYTDLYEHSGEIGSVCHGDCNQHNVLLTDQGPMLINYDRWTWDCQVADLFLFMRKILEKNNWNVRLGQDIILAYHQQRPLSEPEVRNLKIRLAYPWKFWKLINHYASSSRTWLTGRNMEKLEIMIRQEKAWLEFIDCCFSELFLRQFTVS